MIRTRVWWLTLALLCAASFATHAQPGRVGQKITGRHANGWNAAAVALNGVTPGVDTSSNPFCSAFGTTSAAATLTVQLSGNGTNWYTSGTNTGAVTGDFGIHFTTGARYVRLISNAAVTITATIQCKAGG